MSTAPGGTNTHRSDYLKDAAAWGRAFDDMEERLVASLRRARLWNETYDDAVIDKNIETMTRLLGCVRLLRDMEENTSAGRRRVLKMIEDVARIADSDDVRYALRMVAYMLA